MHYAFRVFLLSLTPLAAQYTLRGGVIDGSSGEPLPFVTISLAGNPTRGVRTNEYGEYLITLPVDSPEDTLILSLLNYESVHQPLGRLESGQTLATGPAHLRHHRTLPSGVLGAKPNARDSSRPGGHATNAGTDQASRADVP